MPLVLLNTEIMVFALLALVLILTIWIIVLEKRLRKIFRGKGGASLEDAISGMSKELEELRKFQAESIAYLKNIEARLKRSIQAIETVRFNPFKGTGDGGNQSFSTAILNEKGDGLILSTLHTRDRVSVFAKSVKKLESAIELTEEERLAIKNAKESLAYQTNKNNEGN